MSNEEKSCESVSFEMLEQAILQSLGTDPDHGKWASLFDSGIRLDASSRSHKCITKFLLDQIHKLYSTTTLKASSLNIDGTCNVRNMRIAEFEAKEMEIIKDLCVLISGGADVTLSAVLNNYQVINQVFLYICRLNTVLAQTLMISKLDGTTEVKADNAVNKNIDCSHPLLDFLLDQGLDPNYASNGEEYGCGGLLGYCISHRLWDAAKLILKYGATPNTNKRALLVPPVLGSWDYPQSFVSLQLYLDGNAKMDDDGKDQLRSGLVEQQKRRTQVYPAHLKLVLDPACNLHGSFDTFPLATIISHYLL